MQTVTRRNTKSTTQRIVVFHLVASFKASALAEEDGIEVLATSTEALAEEVEKMRQRDRQLGLSRRCHADWPAESTTKKEALAEDEE